MSITSGLTKARKTAGLMMRCTGAVATGLLMVTVITLGLLVLGDGDEPQVKTASYTIPFPEDEQMLKDLSRQLVRQATADAVRRAADEDLDNIEPAAGGDDGADGEEDATAHAGLK